MYFEDLTPYSYSEIDRDPNLFNVGWLDAKHSFPTGVVSENILSKVMNLCIHGVMRARGFHICNICPPPTKSDVQLLERAYFITTAQGDILLGSAQIRVKGKEEKIYAAPDLLYHYIKDHNYLPPDEFVEAVEQWEPN